MALSRRDLCAALPFLVLAGHLTAEDRGSLHSEVYRFDQLPVHHFGKNLTSRNILDGTLGGGFHIALHESKLEPHSIPHPPHHHRHEEMVLIMEGTLEFTINGKATRAGAGSVMFAASNDEHGIRNPEAVPASYYVLALGSEDS